MSETITAKPGLRSGLDLVLRPGQILVNLIIKYLAPMFLAATNGDVGLARMAAAQTIELSRAESQADLITVAKITAFGLAALSSLNLSMDEDLPVALKLKLRQNATACDRAEQQNRRVREANRQKADHEARYEFAAAEETQAGIDALRTQVAETLKRATETLAALADPAAKAPEEDLQHALRATAAANMAAETVARLDQMQPADRRAAIVWIQVLDDSANAQMLQPTGMLQPAGMRQPTGAPGCSAS